jgi:hypothetical protein
MFDGSRTFDLNIAPSVEKLEPEPSGTVRRRDAFSAPRNSRSVRGRQRDFSHLSIVKMLMSQSRDGRDRQTDDTSDTIKSMLRRTVINHFMETFRRTRSSTHTGRLVEISGERAALGNKHTYPIEKCVRVTCHFGRYHRRGLLETALCVRIADALRS